MTGCPRCTKVTAFSLKIPFAWSPIQAQYMHFTLREEMVAASSAFKSKQPLSPKPSLLHGIQRCTLLNLSDRSNLSTDHERMRRACTFPITCGNTTKRSASGKDITSKVCGNHKSFDVCSSFSLFLCKFQSMLHHQCSRPIYAPNPEDNPPQTS